MNTSADEIIIIARIGAPHGVQGWMRIHSFTEHKQNIINYLPWLIKINGQWQAMDILAHRCHGEQIIINVPDYQDRTAASELCHCEIGIYRKQLPILAQGDYYWRDLEGLTVINQANISLGVVTHLIATGANDVMVIKGEKEHLVPFMLNKFVTAVDFKHRQIMVNWDPDLYP